MRTTDKQIFFWGGPFSQWYSSKFCDENGTFYNCAEQYMMAEKARTFSDGGSLSMIMKSTDPKRQKAIGRKVLGFEPDVWALKSRDVVTIGSHFKFSQNPDLEKILLDTGDKEIVEASPYDRIWGIGLREDDPRVEDRSSWLGLNWLGLCLMEARNQIREAKNER